MNTNGSLPFLKNYSQVVVGAVVLRIVIFEKRFGKNHSKNGWIWSSCLVGA